MSNSPQSTYTMTIVTGAIITLCVLIFQSCLSQSPSEIDDLQKFSLVAFSIAIPGLSYWYYVSYYATKTGKLIPIRGKHSTKHAVVFLIMLFTSYLSALIGIGLTIWRFYTLAGIIFFTVSIISVFYFVIIEFSDK